MEIWRDINGFEGAYQVSNFGRVKSLARISSCGRNIRERLLKPTHPKGYAIVGMHIGGTQTTCTIHKLVATAFIPKTVNKTEVNHINGIKTDNHSDNLEWVTHAENMIHATKERLGNKKAKTIKMISPDGLIIRIFPSISSAAKTLSINKSMVQLAAKSKNRMYKGYFWHT